MAQQATSPIFEEVFQNIRKASEANLKLQQEMFRQCTSLWPGISTPQTVWTDKVKDVQSKLSSTISDLARKHREVVDKQYDAAIESLDSALRLSESTTPEEFRRRAEQFCRKTIECVREMSETQTREFQESVRKWTETMTKAGS
jgi:hypothetical protein